MGRPKHLRKKPITSSDSLKSASSKATQSVIANYHTLRKRQAQLERQLKGLAAPNDEHAKVSQQLERTKKELEATGGLKAYQRASLQGQSSDRGGDSSAVLIPWLLERKASLTSGGHVRLLELGALTPDNFASCSRWMTHVPIDLHSQHPRILEQDFFQRPPPSTTDEAFNAISCSLVLNFVDRPEDRGRMLQLCHAQLVPDERSLLFLVLPLPCVQNSRYLSVVSLRALMRVVGFELVAERHKENGKVGYWLWAWRQPDLAKRDRFQRKAVENDGAKRNNFAILLPGDT